MINTINIALSGLYANSKRIEASASNIANASTKDYTPVDAKQTPVENGGVKADIVPRSAPFDNVDFAEEAVNIKVASNLYKANIAVIKTTDALYDDLIDTLSKKD